MLLPSSSKPGVFHQLLDTHWSACSVWSFLLMRFQRTGLSVRMSSVVFWELGACAVEGRLLSQNI